MFAPIDYSHIETALASLSGWAELAIVGACFLAGWLLDRRMHVESSSEAELVRVGLGGVNRVLFPLATLILLIVAYAVFRHWQPPFFIAIALPLTIALAAIRIIVYALQGLFGTPSWLPVSERVIAFGIWGLALLYFTGVLPELRTMLASLEIPIGSKRVDLLEILHAVIAVVLTVSVTLWLSGLVEQRLLRATHLDTNVRAVLSKFIRALLIVVGVLFGLQAVGIDLTLLTVFGGALGVGIGLGLQKLASNYIAGFAILLDRSIRVGDMITVDNRTGIVAKVNARYVVLRSLDGVEAIVPNETLATTTVLNHSYSNKDVRMAIPVQVSYDSDIDLALAVDGRRGEGRAARHAHAGAPGSLCRPLRRQRHRSRAGTLDQRPGKRPAQPAQRDQPADLDRLPGPRHQDPVPAAGIPPLGADTTGKAALRWQPPPVPPKIQSEQGIRG